MNAKKANAENEPGYEYRVLDSIGCVYPARKLHNYADAVTTKFAADSTWPSSQRGPHRIVRREIGEWQDVAAPTPTIPERSAP